jgi:uncharacterized protein (TIGR02996 family)
VTTEDDFQAALDGNYRDWQTRLVFADWLQDRNDPRAEGYRALGRGGRWTFNVNTSGKGLELWTWFPEEKGLDPQRRLPTAWFRKLAGWECLYSDGSKANSRQWKDYRSRRAAEDAAALAFAKLSDARRLGLLAAGPPGEAGGAGRVGPVPPTPRPARVKRRARRSRKRP